MIETNPNRPKLQKFLANAGLCSRRKGEEWIQEGIVSINGEQAKLGERVTPDTDIIKVNGKRVQVIEDEFLKIDEIKPSKGKSLRSNKLDIFMSHGKKREIRRIFFHFGYKVKKLRRVSIGGLGIRNMSLGQSRMLKKEEIDLLFPKEVS